MRHKKFVFFLIVLLLFARTYFINILQFTDNNVLVKEDLHNTELETEIIEEDYSTLVDDYDPSNRYGYTQLSKEEQKVYKQLLNAILCQNTDIEISTILDSDKIDVIKQVILMDYSNLFWLDNLKYAWSETENGKIVSNIKVTISYTMSEELRKEKQEALDKAVRDLLKGLKKDSSDYKKVKYVYKKLIHKIDYAKEDIDNEYNQTILSALLDNNTVCAGYAKATSYILNKLGIQSCYVYGDVVKRGSHAWNIVKVNDNYYYVDATFGDGSFVNEEDNFINYNFLLIDDETLIQTHTLSKDIPIKLPKCNSTEENYFKKEKLYFNEYTDKGISRLTRLIEKSKDKYIQIKCSDANVAAQYGDYVYDTLYKGISYVDDEKTVILIQVYND